jgi:hypothetical protein
MRSWSCPILQRLFQAYEAIVPSTSFRRRFRMSRLVSMRILEGVQAHGDYYDARMMPLVRLDFLLIKNAL